VLRLSNVLVRPQRLTRASDERKAKDAEQFFYKMNIAGTTLPPRKAQSDPAENGLRTDLLIGIAASELSHAERGAVLRILLGAAGTVEDLVPEPWNRLAKARAGLWALLEAGHVVRDGTRLLVVEGSFVPPSFAKVAQLELPEEPGLGAALAQLSRGPVPDRTRPVQDRTGGQGGVFHGRPPDPPGAKSRVSIGRNEPSAAAETEKEVAEKEVIGGLGVPRFNRLTDSSVITENEISGITDEDRLTRRTLARQLTEVELMRELEKLLGADEMARAGGHWRVDHVRRHPGLLQRCMIDLRELVDAGWTFRTNRAAWLEGAIKGEHARAARHPSPIKGISFPAQNPTGAK